MTTRLIAATAIVLCLTAPALAQTSIATSGNVFAEAVSEIRGVVLEGCAASIASLNPPPSQIGIGLEVVDLKELDPSQRLSLLQYVDAALKQIGATDRRVGHRNTFMIDREARPQQQRILDNTHLNMLVSVLTKGDKREFQLSAAPAPRFADKLGFECGGSSATYAIPDELIGERFFTFEEVVRQFAQSMFAQVQTRRHRMMVVSPDRDLENVTGEAVSILLKEFDRLRSTFRQVGAEQAIIRVSQEKTDLESAADETPWEIRITFSVQPREAVRVSVVGNVLKASGDASAVAQTGLVRQALLPARMVQQARPDAVGADRMKRMQVAGVKPVMINDGVNRFQDSAGRESVAYNFSLGQRRVVEFDLERERGSRPLTLFTANGAEISPAFVGNAARPNLRRFSLGPGEYFLRMGQSGTQNPDGYVLRARSTDLILEPEPPGELLRNFGEWSVGVINNGPVRSCYAYTTASSGSRIDRLQKPVMWFAITNEPSAPVLHYLDFRQFYRDQSQISAQVWSRSQMLRTINVQTREDGLVIPIERTASGASVLSVEGIRSYTQGSTLRIRGTTPSGAASEVVYSLVGYTQSMNAMAVNCGRPDLIQSLVL
jgi:hypothetical protein